MVATGCPSEETLAALTENQLEGEARAEVERHLADCERCAGVVSLVAQTSATVVEGESTVTLLPRPGSKLGRYHVLEQIGRGAMGAVYSAYDPQLQRRVALKVQLPVESSSARDRQDRFVKEAQAVAAVSHPNVIAVHDVGVESGTAFFAMEFIEGQTLRGWLQTDRSVREVMSVFGAAARGIAAAHAKGLVHRDFKPDNVLIGGDDGRVRVIDFGLVRFVDTDHETGEGDDAASPDPESTRTGALIGTPAYMAPEQLRGEPADPRTDQFAFCVTLYQALVGHRPFKGNTIAGLLESIDSKVAWPTTTPRLSRGVRTAIERGLQPDPARRFESMSALVQVLEGKRFNQWLMVASVGVAVIGTAAAVQVWVGERARACSAAASHMDGVWDDAQREAVSAAILDVEIPYAPSVSDEVRADLDQYSQDWVDMHTSTCRATSVLKEASAEVMDARMACLDQARVQLSAAVGVLATADADVVLNATELLSALPSLEQCATKERLDADVVPPANDAEERAVERARSILAEAKAEGDAGRYEAAAVKLDAAKDALQSVSYGPVQTEVELVQGQVLQDLGEWEGAERALERAQQSAAQWHQWQMMGEATALLMRVVGVQRWRPEDALRYLPIARGLAQGDAEAELAVTAAYAEVLSAKGDFPEAEAQFRRAIEVRQAVVGPEHNEVLSLRNGLARVHAKQGKHDDAVAEHRAILEIRERTLGARHPLVGSSQNNLGQALAMSGRFEEAREQFQAALEQMAESLGPAHRRSLITRSNIAGVLTSLGREEEAEAMMRETIAQWEASADPDHPGHADARNNLATALFTQQRFDEVAEQMRAVLAIRRRTLGPEHPEVARASMNLGMALGAAKKRPEAEAEFRAALAIGLASVGPEHPIVANIRGNLGTVLFLQERYPAAEEELRKALAVSEGVLGPEHPKTASTVHDLAKVLLAQGEVAQSVEFAERAWATRKTRSPRPKADTAFTLAQALWARRDRDSRRRAHDLASEALEAIREAPRPEEGIEKIQAWLRTHPRP